MKARKKYRIGCRDYRFIWVGKNWERECHAVGQHDPLFQTITVSKDSPRRMQCLLHEAIHEIEHEHQLDLSEQDIGIFSEHIIAFCRDNNVDLREELEG